MKKLFHMIFEKPTFFYDPLMKKGEGRNALYSVTIYKYHRGKSKPIMTYADKKPLKVMKSVQEYIKSVRSH